MKYKVVESENLEALCKFVEAAHKESGWVPQGGISAAHSPETEAYFPRTTFYQAMVLDDE